MKILLYILLFISFITESYSHSIIRDDEIESTINQIIDPLSKNAGMQGKIKVNIINDSSINAFATRGNNIFLNTGLIIKSKTPDMLAGVIAHEIGHIHAGHPLFRQEELINSQIFDVASVLLGVASIIAGNPDVGATIVVGGSQIGKNRFLEYSRNQEQAADQSAIFLLKKSEIPLDGTMDILKLISKYDTKALRNIYTRTHPFASDRANIVKGHLQETAGYSKYKYIDQQSYEFARIKLEAYTVENKGRDYIKAIQNSNSNQHIYAKTIINMRMHNFVEAHKNIDILLKNFPNNPYFYEHKAQIFLEQRRFEDAILNYNKAMKYIPNSELLNIQTALCYISIAERDHKKELLKIAISHIEKAISINKESYIAYQLGVRSSGALGDNALKEYFLAKSYLLMNNNLKSKLHASNAKKHMDKNHKYYTQVLDILND